MPSPGRTFTWRGVVREHRPLMASEVGERIPSRAIGSRVMAERATNDLWVGERNAAILESIADRRGITVAEALELVCADVIGRRA